MTTRAPDGAANLALIAMTEFDISLTPCIVRGRMKFKWVMYLGL